jgi:hypothetical protein
MSAASRQTVQTPQYGTKADTVPVIVAGEQVVIPFIHGPTHYQTFLRFASRAH